MHTGELVQGMEDFIANSLILATRNAGQAQGGQILVPFLLKELVASAGDIRLGEEQEVEMKGS